MLDGMMNSVRETLKSPYLAGRRNPAVSMGFLDAAAFAGMTGKSICSEIPTGVPLSRQWERGLNMNISARFDCARHVVRIRLNDYVQPVQLV